MTARGVIADPRATRTAAEEPQQVGGHATFIKKHILTEIAQRLPLTPVAPFRRDVGPTLFIGVDRFFSG
jgi:hypothetical protein